MELRAKKVGRGRERRKKREFRGWPRKEGSKIFCGGELSAFRYCIPKVVVRKKRRRASRTKDALSEGVKSQG